MPDATGVGSGSGSSVVMIEQMHSGYGLSSAQWELFLDCWAKRVPHHSQGVSATLRRGSESETKAILSELERLEGRYDLVLPPSYRDFVVSIDSSSWLSARASDHVGFYAPRDVMRVGELFPEVLNAAQRYPIESDDADYFVYGTDQDDSSGRVSYLEEALVVGKYGRAEFELILLYPQIRTKDGEFEAALRFHAGEFRAPTFAELMRQLSFMETTNQEHVPPYSQAEMMGSCADLLPLRGVWWK